jgi:hypothetical protein
VKPVAYVTGSNTSVEGWVSVYGSELHEEDRRVKGRVQGARDAAEELLRARGYTTRRHA